MAGRLQFPTWSPVAVSSKEPWCNLPGLKPLVSLGLKDFVFKGCNGLMAPKGTPTGGCCEVERSVSTALGSEESVRAFNAIGFKPGASTQDAMKAQIEDDMRLFTNVIRERRLSFDTCTSALPGQANAALANGEH